MSKLTVKDVIQSINDREFAGRMVHPAIVLLRDLMCGIADELTEGTPHTWEFDVDFNADSVVLRMLKPTPHEWSCQIRSENVTISFGDNLDFRSIGCPTKKIVDQWDAVYRSQVEQLLLTDLSIVVNRRP